MGERDKGDPQYAERWLDRANENLRLSRHSEIEGVSLELLAFHAQQAAEFALKAVCHHRQLEYERTHDIQFLLKEMQDAGVVIPDSFRDAPSLTRFAVRTRYPGDEAPITVEAYQFAVRIAEEVCGWAEQQIGPESEK